METVFILGALIVAVTWLNVEYRRNRSPEWSYFYLWAFWRRTTLIDGSALRFGDVMRRFVNGRYQFRRLTQEEAAEREGRRVW